MQQKGKNSLKFMDLSFYSWKTPVDLVLKLFLSKMPSTF